MTAFAIVATMLLALYLIASFPNDPHAPA